MSSKTFAAASLDPFVLIIIHKTYNEQKLTTEIEILKSDIKSVIHNFEILKLKVEDMKHLMKWIKF